MEVLTPAIVTTPSIFSKVQDFSSNFHAFAEKRCKKNSSRDGLTSSFFALHFPFSRYSLSSGLRGFRILAHFGRPTTRRNHLRKKLTERQEQVHPSPIAHELASNFQFPVHKSDGGTVQLNSDNGKESKSRRLRDKLQNWIDQYKNDSEFWGIGSGDIFTVFHDSHGKVEKVVVDEDEILRRSQIEPSQFKKYEFEDLKEVNSKIFYAKGLAREMEAGNNVLPRSSSVAKFIYSGEQAGFRHAIQPGLLPRASSLGVVMLCGLFIIWAGKSVFTVGKDVDEYSRLEKEMLKRKVKARKEKESLVKGSVEVMQESKEKDVVTSTKRPQLDKQAVMDNILKAKASNDGLTLPEKSGSHVVQSLDFDCKVEEIRAMARQVRDLDQKYKPNDNTRNDDENNESSNEMEVGQLNQDKGMDFSTVFSETNVSLGEHIGLESDDVCKDNDTVSVNVMAVVRKSTLQSTTAVDVNDKSSDHSIGGVNDKASASNSLNGVEGNQCTDTSSVQSHKLLNESKSTKRRKIILSIEEARVYLDGKRAKEELSQEQKVETMEKFDNVSSCPIQRNTIDNESLILSDNAQDLIPSTSCGTLNHISAAECSGDSELNWTAHDISAVVEEEDDVTNLQTSPSVLVRESSENIEGSTLSVPVICREKERHSSVNNMLCDGNKSQQSVATGTQATASGSCEKAPLKMNEALSARNFCTGGVVEETEAFNAQGLENFMSHKSDIRSENTSLQAEKNSWIEKNYHEFEPIVEKIRAGFRDNYMAARQSSNEKLVNEMDRLKSCDNALELDWLKDNELRDIVFLVRENELAGRDPFFQMNDEHKLAFFNGLEKKVEKENEKLLKLHAWLHSNIENLDYGADGISLYDPPEKIIPRWKGPLPEFRSDFVGERKEVQNTPKSLFVSDKGDASRESKGLQSRVSSSTFAVSDQDAKVQDNAPKTVIEGSDGSLRVGKRSGKEYWQHTKKWSRGFLESYNAEQDPEIKATMKDIGKGLDRWITEKEIKEAADLMNKIPDRGKKFIEEKLEKVRREMKLFGPQAVVSKYSEYADEEEDYLWWLDLPFILCIELYTEEDGEQKIGFYSLEMGADLELEPKPYHVIAFEDAGDCKNLCYIIQAQMEMLGNGNAFVVAQPPKDAFREAKDNGFSLTVIRKGQLQLNVDQTLEEVEEQIMEIGSKIYHDKIMRERSVDISSIMKGVFGVSKPTKRRKRSMRRKLKRLNKRP